MHFDYLNYILKFSLFMSKKWSIEFNDFLQGESLTFVQKNIQKPIDVGYVLGYICSNHPKPYTDKKNEHKYDHRFARFFLHRSLLIADMSSNTWTLRQTPSTAGADAAAFNFMTYTTEGSRSCCSETWFSMKLWATISRSSFILL